MVWVIKDSVTGKYSNGVIHAYNGRPCVGWSKTGKKWSSEKLLKEHILKYSQMHASGQCPETWQVLEVKEEPTKPVNDWIDATMVMKLLKKKRNF